MSVPTPSAPAAPPREVRTAFRLFVANVVCGALGLASVLLILPRLARAVQRSTPGVDPQRVLSATTAGVAVVLVIGLLVLGAELFLAFRMHRGRNWARIVLTVLGSISVVLFGVQSGDLGSRFSAGPIAAGGALLQIVGVLLVLAAGSFMFRPAASRYFRSSTA